MSPGRALPQLRSHIAQNTNGSKPKGIGAYLVATFRDGACLARKGRVGENGGLFEQSAGQCLSYFTISLIKTG